MVLGQEIPLHPWTTLVTDIFFFFIQCTQASVKNVPTPAHLIANLAYQLKSHHNKNLYLRARLDTCADVNIMSASVYRLMFKDPEMKKLAPSELEIETYTTYTVKIVGSCRFYLVNLDSKKSVDTDHYTHGQHL